MVWVPIHILLLFWVAGLHFRLVFAWILDGRWGLEIVDDVVKFSLTMCDRRFDTVKKGTLLFFET